MILLCIHSIFNTDSGSEGPTTHGHRAFWATPFYLQVALDKSLREARREQDGPEGDKEMSATRVSVICGALLISELQFFHFQNTD